MPLDLRRIRPDERPPPEYFLPEGCRQSPVLDIIPEVAAAPFISVHERGDELRDKLDELRIRVEFDDVDTTFQAWASPTTRVITIGLATVERLWAYVNGYVTIIRCTADQVGKSRHIRLDASADSRVAMELLARALATDVEGQPFQWPSELATPRHDVATGTPDALVLAMFLDSMAWITLHEIGHIALGHATPIGLTTHEKHRDEYEADRWASNWMLGDHATAIQNAPLLFARRSAGITIALSILATFDVYRRAGVVGTHPDPCDRINQFLSTFVGNGAPNDWAWWVGIHVLKPNFDRFGISFPDREYNTAQECFHELLLVLKRHRT